jgi:hypothetical protein
MTRGAALRLVLGVGLLAVVLSRADWAEARRSLATANGTWLAGAFLAQVVAKLVWCRRWAALLEGAGHPRRVGELFGMVLVGLFFGSFLPSSVGGDVARGWVLAERGVPRAVAAASVVADRLVGVLSLAVAAGVGAALGVSGGASPWVAVVAALAAGAAAAGIAARPEALGAAADRLPGGLRRRARRLVAAFAVVAGHRGPLFRALFWSGVMVALSAAYHWALARALGLSVPLSAWLVIVPAVMLLSTIPVTPNGMGIREAGFVGFLSAQGVGASPAALFAVMAFLVPLPLAVAGGLLFAARARRAPRPAGKETER